MKPTTSQPTPPAAYFSDVKAFARAAAERFGSRGAVWAVEGRSAPEMEALEILTGTRVGKALETCKTPLLNLTQAAELFGVSPMTIMRADKVGIFPPTIKVGRCERWTRESLTTWAANGFPSGGVVGAEPVPGFSK